MAIRLAVSAGTAALAVCAVGFQAVGSVPDRGQMAADGPGQGLTKVAAASASRWPVPIVVVSAPADTLLSFSRSVVLTGTTKPTGSLHAASAGLRRPAPGTLTAALEDLTPSSPYGLRTSPITGAAGEFHWGLDFSAPCGTHVFSADAGVVRAVGCHQWGGGNRVELDHGKAHHHL